MKKLNPDQQNLIDRLQSADFSANNPKIQNLVEIEVRDWFESYTEKNLDAMI